MVPDDAQPFNPLESDEEFTKYVQNADDSELETFMLALALGLTQEMMRKRAAE